MEFSIAHADDRFELSLAGKAMPSDYDKLLDALTTHQKWQPGSPVLSDETTLETAHLSSVDIAKVANICEKYRDAIGKAKMATIAQEDLVFGLNRMWEVHVQDKWMAEVMVFRSRADALDWLAG